MFFIRVIEHCRPALHFRTIEDDAVDEQAYIDALLVPIFGCCSIGVSMTSIAGAIFANDHG